jgi:hypothetical protein
MELSVKETLIYFDYTYDPNLTHQGEFVITKNLSATLQTTVEERHQIQKKLVHLRHQIQQKWNKTIYLVH